MNKYQAAISVTITPEMVADQIVTAIEGGSVDWLTEFHAAKGQEIATQKPWYSDPEFWAGNFVVAATVDGDDGSVHLLMPENIDSGLKWLSKNHPRRIQEIIDETGDAETADVFLQACLFGDIVYG